jgi:hypothetical protein
MWLSLHSNRCRHAHRPTVARTIPLIRVPGTPRT